MGMNRRHGAAVDSAEDAPFFQAVKIRAYGYFGDSKIPAQIGHGDGTPLQKGIDDYLLSFAYFDHHL
jgi:hypothetical protein